MAKSDYLYLAQSRNARMSAGLPLATPGARPTPVRESSVLSGTVTMLSPVRRCSDTIWSSGMT